MHIVNYLQKKRALLLVLFIGLCCSTQAQLQRNIFGLELARSTKANVIAYLNEHNIQYKGMGEFDAISTKDDLYFAGYAWNVVIFQFYQNILYGISLFQYPYMINSFGDIEDDRNFVDKRFQQIQKQLRNKYPSVEYIIENPQSSIVLRDNMTVVTLNGLENGEALVLGYMDRRLARMVRDGSDL